MAPTTTEAAPAIPAAPVPDQGVLLADVQCFLARQMQLMDSGAVDEWAATFTPDGVFSANAYPEPVAGREAIAAAARAAAADFAARGIVRRHWLGMVTAAPGDDGTVHARSYALVIATPRGGAPAIQSSSVCDDVLVPHDGSWRVRRREVARDDL